MATACDPSGPAGGGDQLLPPLEPLLPDEPDEEVLDDELLDAAACSCCCWAAASAAAFSRAILSRRACRSLIACARSLCSPPSICWRALTAAWMSALCCVASATSFSAFFSSTF